MTAARAPPARRSGPPSRRPSTWRPASAGRSGSRSPGTSRSSSSGPGGAGGSATRAIGAGPATRAFDLAHARAGAGAALARGDRGLAATGPRRQPSAPTGTRRRSSTSSTSWSTAAPSGRPARSTDPEPRPRRPGPLRAARVPRLPVLRQRRCRLLRVVRDPAALPRARGARHPRPPGGDRGRRPGDRHDRGVRASARRARSAAPCRTTSAAPTTTRSTARTATDYQDVNDWKDLGPKFVLQVWRDAVAAGADGDALIRDAWPTVEALLTRLATPRPRRRRAARARRPARPDLRHLADARAIGLWRVALAGCPGGRGGDGRAGWARPRPRRHWAGWFERGQVAFDRRLWRGDHYAYDDGGGAELGQHHGRPARRPVVRRRDGPRRPPARATGSRPRCGPSIG